MIRLLREKKWYKIIKKSAFFDRNFYLKSYPDVALANIEPIKHYIRYGTKEGRNPSCSFDTNYYLMTYKDIDVNVMNPLVHYILYGQFEGRQPSMNQNQSGADFSKNNDIQNKKDNNLIKMRQGYCPCCDSSVKFSSKQTWLRDHYLCSNCGCIPRERLLTYVIEQMLPNWKELSIHESSPATRGASDKLRKNCKNYIASHYYPNSKEEYVNSYKNIDLHHQNFEDESFDLVVTQDVFEHLPYPELAIKEIARTLKKGGYFISTVPLVNKFNPTQQWAELVDGEVKFFYAPDYHGNPIDPKGSPVFWHYGYDIASKFIEWSGMETIIVSNVIPELGIEAELLEVIVCRKI